MSVCGWISLTSSSPGASSEMCKSQIALQSLLCLAVSCVKIDNMGFISLPWAATISCLACLVGCSPFSPGASSEIGESQIALPSLLLTTSRVLSPLLIDTSAAIYPSACWRFVCSYLSICMLEVRLQLAIHLHAGGSSAASCPSACLRYVCN
jgi:hypothetical protein